MQSINLEFKSAPQTLSLSLLPSLELEQQNGSFQNRYLSAVVKIQGKLKTRFLEKAVNILYSQHKILKGDLPADAKHRINLIYLNQDLCVSEHEIEKELYWGIIPEIHRNIIKEENQSGLVPLLLQVSESKYFLILAMLYKITDEASAYLIIREIGRIYSDLIKGKKIEWFEDNVLLEEIFQSSRKYTNTFEHQMDFWRQELMCLPEDLDWPPDKSSREKNHNQTAVYEVELKDLLAKLVKNISRELQVSCYAVFVTILKILLHRYTNQEDIMIGMQISRRAEQPLQFLVGPYDQTVILRSKLTGHNKFIEILKQIHIKIQTIEKNTDIDFQENWQNIKPGGRVDLETGLKLQCRYEKRDSTELKCHDTLWTIQSIQSCKAKTDLYITFLEYPNQFKIQFEYQTDLFKKYAIQNMAEHFLNLYTNAVQKPDCPVSRLEFLSEKEKHQQLVEWNQNQRVYSNEMLISIFEAQAQKTPNAVAVIDRAIELTYVQLNTYAGRIASRLWQLKVGPEMPVGVLLPRSYYTLIAIFAIFKCGAVYVPLDLSYPGDHIAYILKETGTTLVLTEKNVASRIQNQQVQVLYLEELMQAQAALEEEAVNKNQAGPNDLAVIMYTSGSTGQPKGVAMEHRQLLNRFHWLWENYPFQSGEVACQRTTINFLPSVWEFLGSILKGVPLVILSDETVKDPERLIQALITHKITRIAVVPSLLKMILEMDTELLRQLNQVKLWFVAGEPLPLELYQRFREYIPHAVLFNDYGATEINGVLGFDSRMENEGMDFIPAGRPIANTRIYILDKYLQPLPIGVPGELYVGGVAVSRGYLNQPDLTKERFIPDPFCSDPLARLYNTGDLARYRFDGMVEVVGRRDHQVKILGKRVELGGIEKVILQYPGITGATVCAIDQIAGAKKLAAFIRANTREVNLKAKLREFCKQKLPDFMVPSDYIILEEMPLLPNGKVDREYLSKTFHTLRKQQPKLKEDRHLPKSEIEIRIAAIWRNVLEIDELSVQDGFMDLGGNSVLMLQVYKELRNAFPQKEITLVDMFFKYPTISALAGYFSRLKEKSNIQTESAVRAATRKQVTQSQREMRLRQRRTGNSDRDKQSGYSQAFIKI